MNLRNDHNVYILGAGFSREAGLPLIGDFLVRMRDSHEWLVREKRQDEADAVEQVLQFRLKAASAAYWVNLDLENIEELFSLASASTGDMDKHIRLAIAATLDYCLQNADQPRIWDLQVSGRSQIFVSAQDDKSPAVHPDWVTPIANANQSSRKEDIGPFNIDRYAFFAARMLGMFKNGAVQGENTFISFNYDTLLEDALAALKLGFSYGFKQETVTSEAPPAFGMASSGIPVLKLHGSVNWARRDESGRSLTVFENYRDVLKAGLTPELVPPTWKKIFEDQLESVWEAAVQRLSTATRVIIIGFSIPPTDMHFKYLMAAGLQNNLSLRQILFINPASEEHLHSRALSLLRNGSADSKFIQFFPRPLSSSLDDDPQGILRQINRQAELAVSCRISWSKR